MTLRDSINENFWLKLFSLCAAVIIWSVITLSTQEGGMRFPGAAKPMDTRDFPDLPITVMTTAGEVRGVSVSPSVVQVTVSGPASDVAQLTPRDIKMFVDLTDAGEGRGFHKRIQYSTPTGIRVDKVIPSEVSIIRVGRQVGQNSND